MERFGRDEANRKGYVLQEVPPPLGAKVSDLAKGKPTRRRKPSAFSSASQATQSPRGLGVPPSSGRGMHSGLASIDEGALPGMNDRFQGVSMDGPRSSVADPTSMGRHMHRI